MAARQRGAERNEENYVQNPRTGRAILVGGATYNRLTDAEKEQADVTAAGKRGGKSRSRSRGAPERAGRSRSRSSSRERKPERSRKRGVQQDGGSYFTAEAEKTLTDGHKKYCRCIAHVSAQQSDDCLHSLKAGARPQLGDKSCYLPYSLCTASVGRTGGGGGECLQYYDLDAIPAEEVRAMAILKTGSDDPKTLYAAQRSAREKIAARAAGKAGGARKSVRGRKR